MAFYREALESVRFAKEVLDDADDVRLIDAAEGLRFAWRYAVDPVAAYEERIAAEAQA